MLIANNVRDIRPLEPQSNVLGLLQELGIIANSSLPVGAALHMSLSAIGSHTGWLMGRVELGPADEVLIGEPAVTWRAGLWPDLPPLEAWPRDLLPDDAASVTTVEVSPTAAATISSTS